MALYGSLRLKTRPTIFLLNADKVEPPTLLEGHQCLFNVR